MGYCRNILIILLFPVFAQGQTRFYFETSSPTDVTPDPTGGWTTATSAIIGRILTSGTKLSTTIASTTIAVNNSSGTATTCFFRGVSAALVAQTISGTVSGQFRMSLSSATGCTAQSRIMITVVNRAGVVVATLLNITSGSTNITTTLTNRTSPGSVAISSYACADGDRIVIEGGIGRSAGTTARNGTISFGSSSASDLASADNTATTANNPWVEFSGNLIFNKGIPF